jgi:O-antigen/teichoic acid export membrane protein
VDPRTAATDTVPALEAEREIATATTGGSVLRGGLWNSASKILPQFFTLVVSIAGARLLGASGLGRQSYIAFVATSAIYVLGLGIPLALMRQIGESVGAGLAPQARGLVRWSLRFSVGGAAIGLVGLTAVALGGAEPQAAWILAGLIVAAGVLTQIPDAIISGLPHWRDSSVVVLWSSALGAVATVLVLAAGGGVTGMIAVQLAVALPILFVMAVLGRRRLFAVAPRSEIAPRALRARTLRYSASVFVGTLVTLVVFRRSEFFFLNHYSTNQQIAFYSIAFAVVTALVRLPSAMGQVLAPAVSTLFGAGAHERIAMGFSRALRLILLATMPIAAAAAALGPETIRLIWGEAYGPAQTPFLIMVATSLVTPLTVLGGALVVGVGRVGVPLLADTGAAVVDIGLAFALVPGHGAVGAALANSAAQVTAGLPLIIYSSRLAGPIRWEARILARTALLSAAGGGAAWAVVTVLGGAAGILVGLLSGAAVFLAGAAVVGILPRDDAEWLADLFGSRLGHRPRQAVLALAGLRAGSGQRRA